MLIRPLLVIALLLCGAPARAADAPAGPYLFDLLKQKPYLAAWNAMLCGRRRSRLGRELRQDLRRPVEPVQGRADSRQGLHARLGVQGA